MSHVFSPLFRRIQPLLQPVCGISRRAALGERFASSKSRWQQRQGRDVYARDAKVKGLKSRAGFKLLEVNRTDLTMIALRLTFTEMDAKHILIKP